MKVRLKRPYSVRIWIGQMPDPLDLSVDDSLRESLPWSQRRLAAIEILVPLGGRALYGLLGGALLPNAHGEAVVWAVTENVNADVEGTLLGPDAGVRLGVGSNELREAVYATAAQVVAQRHLTGEVVIGLAAYSDLYSTRSVFKWLAGTLVTLLALPAAPESEEEVIKALTPWLTPDSIFGRTVP